jgi:predicted Fe-Mo cluster-binding NifX family protein
MRKRIAIPVTNNQLSEYFGICNHCEIFEIDGKVVGKKEAISPSIPIPSELSKWLKKQGITDVISHKVHRRIIHLFSSSKVNLFVGIPRESPQKLVEAWMEGKLESDEQIISEINNSEN